MGLADVQRALALLATDTSLLRRFVAAPQKVGDDLGLDPADTLQLTKISLSELQQFARSLKSKRRNEVTKLLPKTCLVLGDRLERLFAQHADEYTPAGNHKHREDALAFAAFLLRSPDIIEPDWLHDLIKFESAWLTVASSGRCVLVRRFQCDITAIVNRLNESGVANNAPCATTIAIWLRLNPEAMARHFVLKMPNFNRKRF